MYLCKLKMKAEPFEFGDHIDFKAIKIKLIFPTDSWNWTQTFPHKASSIGLN